MNLKQKLDKFRNISLLSLLALLLPACQSTEPYLKTVKRVEIDRFMGEWYVIASRPTFMEEGAYNATESYTLQGDSIDVLFKFHEDSYDGSLESIPQTAKIHNSETQAHWKISTWWMPFSLDYLIIGLADDYQWTAVGVPNQNYLWVMSRTPVMSDHKLQEILQQLANTGYNTKDVKRVPQQPLAQRSAAH